jgi:DNA-binding CsgD family transcriptional regulator
MSCWLVSVDIRGPFRMLEVFGLTRQAESIYRLMLAEPQLGVASLCERLELTDAEVRAALDELVTVALLRESREARGRLRVVRPEIGIETLLRRQEEQLVARQQELAVARTQVAEMVADYLETAGRDHIAPAQDGRLIGLDAIQAELEILARDMRTDCRAVLPGGAQSQASIDNALPLNADALSRGISILTLLQDSARHDPATLAYARWLTDRGAQVRTAAVLPPRMLIFDQRVAVIPIDPANTKRGALRTRELSIVRSLLAVFEQAWNAAIPFGAPLAPDAGTGLTRLDQELLKLLSSGMTDEAAGNRLGISARTVRRQMSALMERLNASSRFEAGLKAAQRGWLLPSQPGLAIATELAIRNGGRPTTPPISRLNRTTADCPNRCRRTAL